MRICIDPGHGGRNIGCQYNGIIEKDYTWVVAYQLGHALRSLNSSFRDLIVYPKFL